jgi:hypothetical protein
MYSNSYFPLYSFAASSTNRGISSFTCLPGLRKNGATTTFLQFFVSINSRKASAIDGDASSMCAGSTSYPLASSTPVFPYIIANISANRSNCSLLDLARLPWSTMMMPTFLPSSDEEEEGDALADECTREEDRKEGKDERAFVLLLWESAARCVAKIEVIIVINIECASAVKE